MLRVEVLLLLLLGILLLTGLAQRLSLPYPVVLVVGGLVLGLLPGLPMISLDPSLILVLFLPPLIYSAAWVTSWREMWRNIRSISFLATGLVVATTLLVGVTAHLLIPGLPWSAAFLLGAIISPTDTVAGEAISERLDLPRRVLSVTQGESLLNDATGLVLYRFALAAVLSGAFSLVAATGEFVLVAVGGFAVGLVVGVVGAWLHRQFLTPLLDITLSLLIPFAAYVLAETLNVSGVLAVVTAGIYIGQRAPRLFTPNARVEALSFWRTLTFLLNGVVFILIGFQLRVILTTTHRELLVQLLGAAIVVSLVVMAVRVAWAYPSAWLAWRLGGILGPRTDRPAWQGVTVVSWMGMRGVVSLAAALALPTAASGALSQTVRDSIIFLTFVVILVTLLVQGLSLPSLIRRLGLDQDKTRRNEARAAHLAIAHVALDRLEGLDGTTGLPEEQLVDLRTHYQERVSILSAIQPDRAPTERHAAKSKHGAYQRVLLDLVEVQRQQAISMRDNGEIGDEVLHDIERELDLEELSERPTV
ncbi:MAG: Na+/H+ antiporter [Ktedonobacterales bacterium]|nr:Na+/H+ antiporter [Ktedonobacterales bacterium]